MNQLEVVIDISALSNTYEVVTSLQRFILHFRGCSFEILAMLLQTTYEKLSLIIASYSHTGDILLCHWLIILFLIQCFQLLGLVYFLPLIGGIMADKFGYGKMVTIGIIVMFAGYLFLSVPLGGGTVAFGAMLAALLLISFGTGLFKGNLQVMVGNLYDTPELASKRDSAFSIFYMAINIGALFAPTAAVKIQSWAEATLHCSSNDAYHFSFAVACVSLIVSMAIYYGCRRMFKHVEGGNGKTEKKDTTVAEEELTPQQTKERIVALCLVFAVVIFFWMAFHQNGLTLTYFANEFVSPVSTGVQSMAFDVQSSHDCAYGV